MTDKNADRSREPASPVPSPPRDQKRFRNQNLSEARLPPKHEPPVHSFVHARVEKSNEHETPVPK